MKKGKEYELLIEKLYKQLEPNAIITQNDSLPGKDSNTNRQIDVSIKYKFANVEQLIVVEVKDHNKPCAIGIVDGFSQVIKDVGANKGILISASGFTNTAIKAAKNLGIEVLTIHSAQKKNWCTEVMCKVTLLRYYFKLEFQVICDIKDLAGKQIDLKENLFSSDGNELVPFGELIRVEILKKKSWKELIRRSGTKLNLKDLNYYWYLEGKFRPIVNGYIHLNFQKKTKSMYTVEPSNYVYEVNHHSKLEKLHNLTIDFDKIMGIINGSSKNQYPDERIDERSSQLKIEVFDFFEHGTIPFVKFNVPGYINGPLIIKNNTLYLPDRDTSKL